MSRVGNLYGTKALVDESLAHNQEITFNTGTHRELIRKHWPHLVRLVKPEVMALASTSMTKSAS